MTRNNRKRRGKKKADYFETYFLRFTDLIPHLAKDAEYDIVAKSVMDGGNDENFEFYNMFPWISVRCYFRPVDVPELNIKWYSMKEIEEMKE